MAIHLLRPGLRFGCLLICSMVGPLAAAEPIGRYEEQLSRLSFDRVFLCRVERSYLARRRAGLVGSPGFLFSVSPQDIADVERDERRRPILRTEGLSAESYLLALEAIAHLTDGDNWRGETNIGRRDRLASISAFLHTNRNEIADVFDDAGAIDGVRLTAAQDRKAATAIRSHCEGTRQR